MKNQTFQIVGSSFAVGEERIDIREAVADGERVVSATGIPTVWKTAGTTNELAGRAVLPVLEECGREDITHVFFVSQSLDRILPSQACVLQDSVGLNVEVLAIDLGQGCSGFVQALQMAVACLEPGKRALVVTADRYRSKIEPSDRATFSLFSDGAAATLIEHSRGPRVVGSAHVTDGAGWRYLYQAESSDPSSDGRLHMDGKQVFLFTKNVIPRLIREACRKAGIVPEELGAIYAHQASALVLKTLTEDPNLAAAEIPTNIGRWGNTTSSTIPILIHERPLGSADERYALLIGFGVGLSASALVLDLRESAS